MKKYQLIKYIIKNKISLSENIYQFILDFILPNGAFRIEQWDWTECLQCWKRDPSFMCTGVFLSTPLWNWRAQKKYYSFQNSYLIAKMAEIFEVPEPVIYSSMQVMRLI